MDLLKRAVAVNNTRHRKLTELRISCNYRIPMLACEVSFSVKQPHFLTRVALLALCVLPVPQLCAQGPPYQTDDPVPVDLHHYEFYIFGSTDGTPAEPDPGPSG